MKNEYSILSKQTLEAFALQQTTGLKHKAKPDVVLEMSFSPKLYIVKDLANKVESLVNQGVEWLDAKVDASVSRPSDEELVIFEDYRMPYIHQTFALTGQDKRNGKLNWLDANNTEFDFSSLEGLPLEQRLMFKLHEDYGLVFIHQSVIDLLHAEAAVVWIRDV